jgi:pimeloyl-ACP methyl ester carboxylesterase
MTAGHDSHWESIGPPPLALFAREHVRAIGELAQGAARRRLLRTAPHGDGHSVLVLPGLLAGDFSTAPLRRFLRELGYDAHGWSLGINRGPSEERTRELRKALLALQEQQGRAVSLIGWSLGGIYARELARAFPTSVRLLITLASPFRDITATHAVRLVSRPPGQPPLHASAELRARLRRPVPVPTTSIYSRTDGVVAWESCLEAPGPRRENVEVDCSHTGMGFHPDTLAIIADRLAQAPGAWRPYHRQTAA